MKHDWFYPDEKILRGALLGCGQVSVYHLRAWKQTHNVRITALANRTVKKAYDLADTFGIAREHVYSSYEELLDKEDIDFVDIATAPDVHYEQTVKAAKYGYHVLCQKPFAPSIGAAMQMIQEATKAGILLSINENWRWRSWYRKIKSILDSGAIGKPKYLYIHRHNNATLLQKNGAKPALLEKQPYTAELIHLILFEWGIHIVDICRFLFGDPVSIYAVSRKVSQYFAGEDRMILHLNFTGLDAVLDLSWATISESDSVSQLEKVIIEGEEGTIKILPEPEGVIKTITRNGVNILPAILGTVESAYQDSYTSAYHHFIDCLRKGELPETNAHDNIKTLAMVFAAYQSAENNSIVDINDFLRINKVYG